MIDESIQLLSRQLQREQLVQNAEARGYDSAATHATNLIKEGRLSFMRI